MRLFFLTKKQQKKYIAYLVGLTRVIHRNNVQLFEQDFESYEFCLKHCVNFRISLVAFPQCKQ